MLALAALVIAACEDTAGPTDTARPDRGLTGSKRAAPSTTDLGALSGSFSANAVLSNDLVVTGSPITYSVDFGVGFGSILEVDYFLTFGSDPLDSGECLEFSVTGACFCNPGPAPQTSRLLTFPCSLFPAECEAFLDGISTGQRTKYLPYPGGPASVRLTSVAITVHVALACTDAVASTARSMTSRNAFLVGWT